MSKIRLTRLIYIVFCVCMTLFFGYVFFQSLHNTTHMDFLNQFITGLKKPLFITGGVLTLATITFLFATLWMHISDKKKRIIALLLCIGAVSIQLCVILILRPSLRYDSLNLLDTALLLKNGGHITSKTLEGYFVLYPLNIPMCYYTLGLIRFASLLGITQNHYITFLQIYNSLALDFSIFLIFMLLRKYRKRDAGSFAYGFLFLCIINPLMYYYPVFYYTQVVCVPFFVCTYVLFFFICSHKAFLPRLIYFSLYGIIFYIGIKIRVLIGIVPIACMIWYILEHGFTFLKRKIFWIGCLICLLLMLISSYIYKSLDSRYNHLTEDDIPLPATHWVMMGLSETGAYNPGDEEFTSSFPTPSARNDATLNEIQNRIIYKGPLGILKLFGRKLTLTWSDGYDDYADNFLMSINYGLVNDLLYGDRKDLCVAYLHIYNAFCLFCLVISAISLLLKRSRVYFTSGLVLLGGMIFHLVWEAGEAYSMPFFLFLILTSSYALYSMNHLKQIKYFQKSRYFYVLSVIPVLYIIMVVCTLRKPLTQIPFVNTSYAALQDMPVGDAITVKNGEILTQTFTTSSTFNRIDIGFLPEDNPREQDVCRFRLLDADGSCLYEQLIPAFELTSMYTLVFADVFPVKSTTYTIELSGMSLLLTGYNTGNWDAYPYGTLRIDKKDFRPADMTFIVYSVTEKTFCGNR